MAEIIDLTSDQPESIAAVARRVDEGVRTWLAEDIESAQLAAQNAKTAVAQAAAQGRLDTLIDVRTKLYELGVTSR